MFALALAFDFSVMKSDTNAALKPKFMQLQVAQMSSERKQMIAKRFNMRVRGWEREASNASNLMTRLKRK